MALPLRSNWSIPRASMSCKFMTVSEFVFHPRFENIFHFLFGKLFENPYTCWFHLFELFQTYSAKAHFRKPVCCCECIYDCLHTHTDARKYLYALENGMEFNNAIMCAPCFTPSCCCPIFDNVSKSYFDHGLWNKQNCLWGIGFFKGNGFFFANNSKCSSESQILSSTCNK